MFIKKKKTVESYFLFIITRESNALKKKKLITFQFYSHAPPPLVLCEKADYVNRVHIYISKQYEQ